MKSAMMIFRRGTLVVWLIAMSTLFHDASLRAADSATKRDTVVVDEKTETVIKGALKWLASKQLANGAWGSSGEEQRYAVAMTAYTLMTFQAAGSIAGRRRIRQERDDGHAVSTRPDFAGRSHRKSQRWSIHVQPRHRGYRAG